MERTQELFEKIDDYLNNCLQDIDKRNFEKSIESNEDLREEVEKYQLIKKALEDEEAILFRQKLINIDKEIEAEKVISIAPKKKSSFLWRAAAIFIALIGLSSVLWLWSPEEEDLFAQYYIPYPIKDITRGDSASTESSFPNVISDYKKGNYKEVIPFLENMINAPSADERLTLYLGNSYLNTDQEENAIDLFKSFDKDSRYYNDARWFMALAYLKINQQKEVVTILQELSTTTNLYKDKAADILRKL